MEPQWDCPCLRADCRYEPPYKLVKVPVVEGINWFNLWEHTPAIAYQEYPRFLRPPGFHEPKTKVVRVPLVPTRTPAAKEAK